jgi:transposase InsO family protein
MTEELKELGLDVGHRRVGRLMRQNSIQVIRTRKYKATTDSNYLLNISPNLLGQAFQASGSNQKCPLIDTAYRIPGDRQAILLTSGLTKAGSIWPSSLICIPGASLPCVICTKIPFG